MKLRILPFLLILPFASYAQNYFQRTYSGSVGQFGFSVVQTPDSGFILGGYTTSYGAGGYDTWLIKTKTNGDTVWTRTFGTPLNDVGFRALPVQGGGYAVAGFYQIAPPDFTDLFLIRTNALGDTLWTRIYGDTMESRALDVIQTNDGGFLLTGFCEHAATMEDFVLVKTNALGDTLWTRLFGGSLTDIAYCSKQTTDGGYITCGETQSFGAGLEDVFLVKTGMNGDTLWTRTYGGSGNDVAYWVIQTPDGGYLLTGESNSASQGNTDVLLMKTDASGNIQWAKLYGGAGQEYGNMVRQTASGYLIAGLTKSFGELNSDVYLLKTDLSGNLQWSKTFGFSHDDAGWSLDLTNDGGMAVCGWSRNNSAIEDMLLIKTDSTASTVPCTYPANTGTVNSPVAASGTPTFVRSGVRTGYYPLAVKTGATVINLCPTGVGEISDENELQVFPNPTRGEFTVTGNINAGMLSVYNVLGKMVYSAAPFSPFLAGGGTGKGISINLSSQPPGLYFITLSQNNTVIARAKVVKQ